MKKRRDKKREKKLKEKENEKKQGPAVTRNIGWV
jgi:hypothetical protein